MLADLPAHAVVGHLVVIVAPLAAILAAVYALRPRARRALRWPLVVTTLLTFVLVLWAGEVGGTLLDALERSSAAAGTTAAGVIDAHAHGSSSLAAAAFALLVAVAVLVPRALAPGRSPQHRAPVAVGVLVLCALATLVTTATTLAQAMQAVWAQQPGWS